MSGEVMIYKFRDGYSLPVKAQVVGERVAEINARIGETFSPKDVIEDARPKNSPLHPCFEWSNKKAADAWRQEQARYLIRSLEIVTIQENAEPVRELAYVSVGENKVGGSAYIPTSVAMTSEAWSDKVIADARAQLAGWRRRYGHLATIAKGFAAVVEAIDQLPQEQKADNGQENRQRAPRNRRPVAIPERDRAPDQVG